MSASITIYGAGSWGTALAVHLAQSGRSVTLWARRSDQARAIRENRYNDEYLPGIEIPADVRVTSDLKEAAQASNLWALAVPSQQLRSFVMSLKPLIRPDIVVVSLAKGIENDSLMTMSQVLEDVLVPQLDRSRIGVLYGPSHAEEVAEGRPTTVVAAAHSPAVAEEIQEAFMTDRLRVYANTDVIGVEIGGSAKNVLAIAAGISDGVGYGDNAKAALVTRGIAEIKRLGLALGAKSMTFAGLAGIGDLVVTCMSQHSRNRGLGEQIGAGKKLEEALADMHMVAEGVKTTQSIHDLAQRHHIEMPITEAVYEVLFNDRRPHEMMEKLMTRSAKRENWLPEVLQER
ncbi:NAD(P)H-dependent glycerol-3-phosphate dehydrogenase [Longibacter salinarum]|uniref:Glycerol-3-phosphate dehydrogenase [NAD(P)+] n=1 Tax=Longibacter salinarum TaxID=1850348 RepID=A0A2A8D2K9_9BACT|nr:NAD(P)H-dependent glycerol-3-phosphate dehydrogenase [Longibacter salinarum]PEN15043.1 NAD(P)H-dependent glycerol-3-phosphate dehydrogenase [Longibacter salinarum]